MSPCTSFCRVIVFLLPWVLALGVLDGVTIAVGPVVQDRDLTSDPVWLKQQLSQRNIALAGGRPAVREKNQERVLGWIRDDPSYRALANLCIKALGASRLRRELHLDVINGKYIQQVDATAKQLEAEAYNDVPRLQRALVVHWNEQYPEDKAAEFKQIVEDLKEAP